MYTYTLVLDSSYQGLGLILEESDACNGSTSLELLLWINSHRGQIPPFFAWIPVNKSLVDIPNLQARVIANSIKTNGKKPCSVERN